MHGRARADKCPTHGQQCGGSEGNGKLGGTMSETDEQIEQTPIAHPSTTDEIRNKGGRPKGSSKPKIDWYARREESWDKMNAAIDGGSPAPAVIRALQSQLDTCNLAIAQVHDEQIKARARRELTRHAESVFEVFDNTFAEFPGSEFDSAEYKNRRTTNET